MKYNLKFNLIPLGLCFGFNSEFFIRNSIFENIFKNIIIFHDCMIDYIKNTSESPEKNTGVIHRRTMHTFDYIMYGLTIYQPFSISEPAKAYYILYKMTWGWR